MQVHSLRNAPNKLYYFTNEKGEGSRKIQKRVVAIDRFTKNKTITKTIVRSRQDRLRSHRSDPISPRDDQMCVLARVRSCIRQIYLIRERIESAVRRGESRRT